MSMLRKTERLLALAMVASLLGVLGLAAITGQVTPCFAVVARTRPLLADASRTAMDRCVGRTPGPLAGLLLDVGLAVTGSDRSAMARRVAEQAEARLATGMFKATQTRCLVILAEDLVGRPNGGTPGLARDTAETTLGDCAASKPAPAPAEDPPDPPRPAP